MTLVMGMKTRDGLFFAADSMVTDEGVQLHGWEKTFKWHGNVPLVWGWSGDLQTSKWASKQILALQPPHDWMIWAKTAAEILMVANGELAKRAAMSGNRNPDLASLLDAGVVNSEPAIIELHRSGTITFDQDDFLAIGVGRQNARVVFETLKEERKTVDEEMMSDTVRLAVSLTPGCGFPVHVFKIDASGVSERNPIESPQKRDA